MLQTLRPSPSQWRKMIHSPCCQEAKCAVFYQPAQPGQQTFQRLGAGKHTIRQFDSSVKIEAQPEPWNSPCIGGQAVPRLFRRTPWPYHILAPALLRPERFDRQVMAPPMLGEGKKNPQGACQERQSRPKGGAAGDCQGDAGIFRRPNGQPVQRGSPDDGAERLTGRRHGSFKSC